MAELRKRKILIDGVRDEILLQIFTENQIGPIFSRSFSARAIRDSAKATSTRCLNRLNSTRYGTAW
ncbi:MAG: 4-hydroxyphenylpyruvate dioxygenase (EC [Candidatus Burkholderia crenata]|nr:MAG: 4-hydroxyphenylpyruvate dioxygenase (EC [Candidatus Burkholderia crenata]